MKDFELLGVEAGLAETSEVVFPHRKRPYPQDIRQRCLDLASSPSVVTELADALTLAAKTIEDLDKEIAQLQNLEVSELHAIWWELRRVLYGYTTQKPDNMEDIIQGMPQEWDMVQEAVKRLQKS